MKLLHRGWRLGIALVAVWLLLAQSIAGAFALGEPGGVRLDAFGNPLCITSGEHGDPGGDRHGVAMACCTIGCAASLASPSTDGGFWRSARFAIEADLGPIPVPVPQAALDGVHPGIPRAPPFL